ncbi:MAG TPA: hypothetical protein ENK62_08560 [Chromatiales bacterium]|nr:hypothetical protein [Chromatiales bacterium]
MRPEEDLPAGARVLRRWGPVVEGSGLPVVRRWMSWGEWWYRVGIWKVGRGKDGVFVRVWEVEGGEVNVDVAGLYVRAAFRPLVLWGLWRGWIGEGEVERYRGGVVAPSESRLRGVDVWLGWLREDLAGVMELVGPGRVEGTLEALGEVSRRMGWDERDRVAVYVEAEDF